MRKTITTKKEIRKAINFSKKVLGQIQSVHYERIDKHNGRMVVMGYAKPITLNDYITGGEFVSWQTKKMTFTIKKSAYYADWINF